MQNPVVFNFVAEVSYIRCFMREFAVSYNLLNFNTNTSERNCFAMCY